LLQRLKGDFSAGRAQLLQKGSDSRAESSASAAKGEAAGNRPSQATASISGTG